MSREKWTQDMRIRVFRSLIEKFGPFTSWSGRRTPSRGNDDYVKFLRAFTFVFANETGEAFTELAIRQQIDFGITRQKELRDQSHIRSYILNTGAALAAGFLSDLDLPNSFTIERPIRGGAKGVANPAAETIIEGTNHVRKWIEDAAELLEKGSLTSRDLPNWIVFCD